MVLQTERQFGTSVPLYSATTTETTSHKHIAQSFQQSLPFQSEFALLESCLVPPVIANLSLALRWSDLEQKDEASGLKSFGSDRRTADWIPHEAARILISDYYRSAERDRIAGVGVAGGGDLAARAARRRSSIRRFHMLHSLDMPSFLQEDAVPPTSGMNGPRTSFQQRKSVEGIHSGANSFKDSANSNSSSIGDKRTNGDVNGINGNGSVDAAYFLASGKSEKKSMENGGAVEPVPRRSRVSSERERKSAKADEMERLATRDDGYFANGATAKVQEGWFSNKVSLDMNGDGMISSKRDSSVSRDDATRERKSTTVDASQRSSVDRTESLRPSREQALRTSAPATSSNHSANNLLLNNKLQHRHTLEVPRTSNSRLSRDTTHTYSSADDTATATGRFSPSTPTRRRNSINLVRRVTRSINSDLHLDDAPQDPDAAAYTEMIKQKRQSRRDRKKEEEEDRVLVGTKVDQNHVNYVMAYNMLTGIRFTVSRTNAKMDRDLTDADFEARHKFSFDV